MNRGTRRLTGAATMVALAATLTAGTLTGGATGATAATGQTRDYLVFYADGAKDQALAAIRKDGGTALSTEGKLGYVVARGPGTRFIESLARQRRRRGRLLRPRDRLRRVGRRARPGQGKRVGHPGGQAVRRRGAARRTAVGHEDDRRHRRQAPTPTRPAAKKVLVGIIDTGVDGKHPDIAPNFNLALSRNFVTDRPNDSNGKTLDGPCESPGCKDPADGTTTATAPTSPARSARRSTASASPASPPSVPRQPARRPGLRPVLPQAQPRRPHLRRRRRHRRGQHELLRRPVAVQLHGQPRRLQGRAARAARHHHRHAARPRLRPQARRHPDQRRSATAPPTSASPQSDATSPDYPADSERVRKVDNSCLNVPAESEGVISVSAVGPTERKAYYSDYGIEQTDLSAPGGDESDRRQEGRRHQDVLAAAPEHVLPRQGELYRDGKPRSSSWSATAWTAPAPTTSTSQAPPWPPRTPPASPPS